MFSIKKFFILFICLLIITAIIGGVVYFRQPERSEIPFPSLGPPPADSAEGIASANPSIIPINEPTAITVTIQITDSRLIPGSVNLQRLDANGKVISLIGNLNDSGTNGDVIAGDKIYSISYTFNETTTTPIWVRVSWALKGVLKRSVSNTLIIDIWREYVDNLFGYEIKYPPPMVPIESADDPSVVGFFRSPEENEWGLPPRFVVNIFETEATNLEKLKELFKTVDGIPDEDISEAMFDTRRFLVVFESMGDDMGVFSYYTHLTENLFISFSTEFPNDQFLAILSSITTQ